MSGVSVAGHFDNGPEAGRRRVLAMRRLRRNLEPVAARSPVRAVGPSRPARVNMTRESDETRTIGGMRTTPFPSRACEVVALTVPEFTRELDLNATVSFDRVCRRFLEDSNRALVWFIRFRALTDWCERDDVTAWLKSEPARAQHASELAASFELNDDWEFDSEGFRSAVDSVGRAGQHR